jgi:hypothetical protein
MAGSMWNTLRADSEEASSDTELLLEAGVLLDELAAPDKRLRQFSNV